PREGNARCCEKPRIREGSRAARSAVRDQAGHVRRDRPGRYLKALLPTMTRSKVDLDPAARVLFVCLGNICRSPTAESVFRSVVEGAGLGDAIRIDSAGIGDWHVGRPPDRRAIAAAQRRGYDLTCLRARQVDVTDFDRFDWIIAMDRSNLRAL